MNDLKQIYGLDGKTALVTGGGTGIGLAIAQCLARAGAKVIIAGRRGDVLEQAQGKISADCAALMINLADIPSLAGQANDIIDAHGPVDILVNNAGNTVKRPFTDSTMRDFDDVFDVHVRGAIELTRGLLPYQIQAGSGSVIFTSSMTAYIGQPDVLGYTVAKTAIEGVIRGLAAEVSGKGVRVNGVAPGWIDTDLYRKATAGDLPRQEKIKSRIPMGHLGQPEDVGWTCAFLASAAAKYITGQVVLVDGGGAAGF